MISSRGRFIWIHPRILPSMNLTSFQTVDFKFNWRTTIAVSLGVFVLVLFHSLERFVCVLSCSTWRMCKNARLLWYFFEWTWCQNMGGACTISVEARTHLCAQLWASRIRIFEELGAWRNRFLHNSRCFQSLCIWPWQQLFRYAALPPLCFFPCLNMFKVSSLQDAWSLAHRDP